MICRFRSVFEPLSSICSSVYKVVSLLARNLQGETLFHIYIMYNYHSTSKYNSDFWRRLTLQICYDAAQAPMVSVG